MGKRHLSFRIKIGGMPDTVELSLCQARRLAIRCQLLAGPPGVLPPATIDGMRQVLRALRCLQLDPVNVVARSHLLVLWSRLGSFGRDDLDTLLWRERWLFEYWAHAASIVLTEDYPIHSMMMRAYPGVTAYRDWMVANDVLRQYILEHLGESGPLPADAFEDRAVVSWQSTGWTNGRNVERMLDALWKEGAVTVAGRDGLRRLWDVAGRDPAGESLTREEAVTLVAQRVRRRPLRRVRPGRRCAEPLAFCHPLNPVSAGVSFVQGESAGRSRRALGPVRKVRAPQGRVVGNADPG